MFVLEVPFMSSRRRRVTAKRLFVTVLAVLMGSGTLLACPGADGVIAEIRTLVETYIRDDISPGLVVGLRFGETTWIEAFGISDIKTRDLLTSEHQFFVGSIAKQLTAAAVLRLIEKGQVSLDASITSYLPDAPEAWSEITIRHLLNHTSGICSLGSMPNDLGEGVIVSEMVIGFIRPTELRFAPGEDWVYSTAGYYVLAYIVERITGAPFEAFVEQEFLGPLGMTETGYRIQREPDRLAGYHRVYWQGEAMFVEPSDDVLGLGFGMYSTVSDLFVWEAALRSGRVVSEVTFAEMTKPTETRSVSGEVSIHDYGFGLELRFDDLGTLSRVGHGGNGGGHIGIVWSYPAEDIVLIVLQNSDSMLPPLLEEIEAVLLSACASE